MKKYIAFACAMVMTLSLFTGCVVKEEDNTSNKSNIADSKTTAMENEEFSNFNVTGYPIVNERITIKAMNNIAAHGGPWGDNMSFFRTMKELTNIDFTFTNTPASDWDTKMNLALAADDLPDVFMSSVGVDNILNYGVKGGKFVNIKDMIDAYMPSMLSRKKQFPGLLSIVTKGDGGIYSFPRILFTATAGPANMYVRTDYMNDAGITKEPETVDEFYDLLKAIQNLKSNDKEFIPLMPRSSSDLQTGHCMDYLLPAFGDYVSDSFEIDGNGKVFYNGTSEQVLHYLEFTRKLFDEKIIYNDVFVADQSTLRALIQKGKTAVTSLGTVFNMDSFPSGNYDVSLLGPLTSEYTDKKKIRSQNVLSDSTVVITNKCKNVEALLRWYDILYSEEDVTPGLNSISPFVGIRGVDWDYTDDTKENYYNILPEDNKLAVGEYLVKFVAPQNYLGLFFPSIATGSSFGNEIKGKHYMKKVYPYSVVSELSYTVLTSEENEKLANIMNDINTYKDQMWAKFITGLEPLSNFDTYKSTIEKMGINDAIKIYQAAYDRLK